MSIMDSDPFEDAFADPAPLDEQPTPYGVVRRGRYMLPNRDGSPRGRATTKNPMGGKGWMRVTNLVSAYSDQYALRMWEIEQALRGVAMDPAAYADLVAALPAWDTLADRYALRGEVEEFLERLKGITGADAGSRHGGARHAMVEGHHAGLPEHHHAPDARRHLALYVSAMQRHRLRALEGMQERIVLVEALEACGRLDNVVECLAAGELLVADLKTQRQFWTGLEVSAQLACYANAVAMWDADAGRWVDMPRVSTTTALVAWMPRETEDGEPRVDILDVDITAGWRTARRAYEVVQDRAAAKSARTPRLRLRPAPPVTETERYAARFAAVETLAEGSALVAECRTAGVWGPELAQSAAKAKARLELVAAEA